MKNTRNELPIGYIVFHHTQIFMIHHTLDIVKEIVKETEEPGR